jgi:hypothetical protein
VQRPLGLFLTRNGTWLHDGQEIRHARLSALLHKSIGRSENGQLSLSTGRGSTPFQCEDSPYLVRTCRIQDGHFILSLSDTTEEKAEPGVSIWVDANGVMHVPVKQNQFWACLTRNAAQFLHDKLEPTEDPSCFQAIGTDLKVRQDESDQDWSKPPHPL